VVRKWERERLVNFLFEAGLLWGLVTCVWLLACGAVSHASMGAGDWALFLAVMIFGYGAAGGLAGALARFFARRSPGRGVFYTGFFLFIMLCLESGWRVREFGPALPALSAARLGMGAGAVLAAALLAFILIKAAGFIRPGGADPMRGGLAAPALCAALLCAAVAGDALIGPQAYHAFAPRARRIAPGDAPHIVLITLDALSVRAMGAYGFGEPGKTFRFTGYDPVDAPHEYWSPATPQIDQIAGEGVVLDRMITPAPLTTPSHASIMTGLTPRAHGVVNNAAPLPDSLATLAERLARRGYDTGAFVNKELCSSYVNMQQGFDTMYLEGGNDGPAYRALARAALPGIWFRVQEKVRQWRGRGDQGQASVDQAVRWVSARNGRPFFLWLHLYNAHAPYDPPLEFRKLFGVSGAKPWTGAKSRSVYLNHTELSDDELFTLQALYHGEAAQDDELTGQLAEELFHRGLLDGAALIITADHGELLYEHDHYIGHAARLYEPILRVPFIMRYPDKIPPGIRRNQLTSTLDIFPTILKLAGVAPPADITGMDLMPIITAPPLSGGGHESVVSETFFPEAEHDMISITQGDYRLTVVPETGKRTLNALSTHIVYLEDMENLYGKIDLANHLSNMETALKEWERTAGPRPQPPLETKVLMKRLKSLGYVR